MHWRHRVLFAVLPALVLVGVAVTAVWGDNGLYARYALQSELRQANTELSAVERENQRLLRQLQSMDKDPVVLERMVAEEIGWGREGTVIYRFEESEAKR